MNTETAIRRLLDESAIRDITARFADAATRNDIAAFRKTWADDGVWIIGDPPRVHARGVDEIATTLTKLRADKEFFVQFAVQGPVEIDGDRATTRCFCHEAARGDESYYRNHCVAFDHLRREPNGWKFVARTFRYLWLDTSPFSGNSVPLFDSTGAVLTAKDDAAKHV